MRKYGFVWKVGPSKIRIVRHIAFCLLMLDIMELGIHTIEREYARGKKRELPIMIISSGDDQQLPPFMFEEGILGHELAARSALTVALKRGNVPVIDLVEVYRAPQTLVQPYNRLSYEGRLVSRKVILKLIESTKSNRGEKWKIRVVGRSSLSPYFRWTHQIGSSSTSLRKYSRRLAEGIQFTAQCEGERGTTQVITSFIFGNEIIILDCFENSLQTQRTTSWSSVCTRIRNIKWRGHSVPIMMYSL